MLERFCVLCKVRQEQLPRQLGRVPSLCLRAADRAVAVTAAPKDRVTALRALLDHHSTGD